MKASQITRKSLSEPAKDHKGRFKSSIDVSNINPYELLQILKEIRGYSYSDLGREFGIGGKSYINEIFHGKKIPNVKLGQKIADFFSLPVEFLWEY